METTTERVLLFILGGIVGYFVRQSLDWLRGQAKRIGDKRRWSQANRIWKRYQSLSFGLEVIQSGWTSGAFLEDQVIATIDRSFSLPQTIIKGLYEDQKSGWEAARLTNDEQIGIFEIDPHRVSEERPKKGSPAHELRIKGHVYRYFDYLATHRLYNYGSDQQKALLAEFAGEPHYLKPTAEFPNSLSVGLSLFCEKGECLVLTRRTQLLSSGGDYGANKVFNAVGEGVIPADIFGDHKGLPRLSPWITAKRGLKQEIGIDFGVLDMLILNSFVWDRRLLDYKFFGYCVNSFARSEIRQAWSKASDRHESWEIQFLDCGSPTQSSRIVQDILDNREDWTPEAILCTLLSLLHFARISPHRFEKLLIARSRT